MKLNIHILFFDYSTVKVENITENRLNVQTKNHIITNVL